MGQTREQRIAELYAEAFERYGTIALWHLRRFERPTVEQALSITRSLRIEGDMGARRLAEEIERVARAGQKLASRDSAGHRVRA